MRTVARAPQRRLTRWIGLLLAGCGFCLAFTHTASAQSEDGIKAAFIYNFAKFTNWPAKAFADANAPINVGFVAADSMADLFEKNVTGKNANGRDFAVKRLSGSAGAESCQIVYIGDGQQAAAVIAAAKGKPILTVGNSDAFAGAGGMVNFIKDGAKIKFDLDLGATSSAELKLDEKIRQLARNVKGG